MGFGRSQFQDMHFSSQSARGRASGVYSDDEYDTINRTDTRTKPRRGPNSANWKYDPSGGKQFWEDVKSEENFKKNTTKEDFAKKVWDEFDEFFSFTE